MAYHSESFRITNLIESTYPKFIDPIEKVLWANWNTGDELPDGKHTVFMSFWSLSLAFAKADLILSEKEVDFFRDVRSIFDSVDQSHVSRTKYQQILLETINNNPELYQISVPSAIVFLDEYDRQIGTNFGDEARKLFFAFANAYIKADGIINAEEENALQSFKEVLYPIAEPNSETTTVSNSHSSIKVPEKSSEELIEELSKMIGLNSVKNDVKELVNFLKIQRLRAEKGLPSIPMSRHLVFYGNPGTGKTTIARLLSEIYKSLNVLSRGHLIEADRAALVAGYVGQTALKVKEVVNSAKGGILFIDEAYTLSGEGSDFGNEAIDALLKLMEDNRDDLIVIVAGYTDKMSKFLSTNPGLKSRFNKYLQFEDYSPSELLQIFTHFSIQAGFSLSKLAEEKLVGIFQLLHDVKDKSFGNARLARNLFEEAVNDQASRIISIPNLTEEVLITLNVEDIPGEVEIHQSTIA